MQTIKDQSEIFELIFQVAESLLHLFVEIIERFADFGFSVFDRILLFVNSSKTRLS
jgi:hypothetical protein